MDPLKGKTPARAAARAAAGSAARALASLRRRLRLDALPRRARPLLAASAVVAAAFAVGSFVVAPDLIARALRLDAERVPGRSARLERVVVNPFTLTVDLVQVVLDAPDAGTMFSARAVRLNFDYRTLLGHRPVLDELAVLAPRLDLSTASTGAAADGTTDLREALERLGRARIGALRVEDGELRLGAAGAPERIVLGGVAVTAAGLDAGGPARYSATVARIAIGDAADAAGASLRLDGSVSLRRPFVSTGQASLDGLAVEALGPWLGPRLAAMSPAGRLSFRGRYRYGAPAAGGQAALSLPDGEARLDDLRLRPAPGLLVRASHAAARVHSAELRVAAGSWAGEARLDVDGETVAVEDGADAAPGTGAALLTASRIAATGVDLEGSADGAAAPRLAVAAVQLADPAMRVVFGPGAAGAAAGPGSVAAPALAGWLAGPVFRTGAPSSDRPFALGRLQLADGRFEVVDAGDTGDPGGPGGPGGAAVPRVLRASGVAGSADPSGLEITGSLEGGASGSLTWRLEAPESGRGAVELRLEHVPAAALAPYAASAFGRALAAGDTDLQLDYVREGSRLEGTLRLEGRHLAFAPSPDPAAAAPEDTPGEGAGGRAAEAADTTPVASPDAAQTAAGAERALDLVMALLEDPRGEARLTAPLEVRDEAEPAAGVAAEVARALRARVAAIAAAPFDVLGSLVGRDAAALGKVQFEAGSAAPSAAGEATLKALADALEQRPGLVLRVAGAFDPKVDKSALARQEIELHVALATAGAALNTEPGPLDFSSPRVQDVLDEFAGQRLTAEQRATVASEFEASANGKIAERQRVPYYRAIFDALVAHTSIAAEALARLGRFRAQSVASALAKLGVAENRIETAGGSAAAPSAGAGVEVPLEVRAAAASAR